MPAKKNICLRSLCRLVAACLLVFAATHAAPPDDQTVQLRDAVARAAAYIIRSCQPSGKFVYRVNLLSPGVPSAKYNLLRHAGTIYALAAYARRYPSADAVDTCIRAARFLKKKSLGPLSGHKDLLAVWSRPELTGSAKPSQAKLGGAGLGLVGLLSTEQLAPGTTPLEDLQALGRFILFMQKPNGSFFSKYIPSGAGRDDSWTSLYYPGEAALGLLMLYSRDPQAAWLEGAAKAISSLARSREHSAVVPADHWALLATAQLLPVYHRSSQPVPRDALVRHAVQICTSILAGIPAQPPGSPYRGSFTSGGGTCQTATRIEGLLAALTFLPAEEQDMRNRIIKAVRGGISFLVRAQIESGPYAGAFPKELQISPGADFHSGKPSERSTSDVRIDYVQHALSALLQYEDFICSAK